MPSYLGTPKRVSIVDVRDRQIPTDAEPAVASFAAVRDGEARLDPAPSGRHGDRERQVGRSRRVGRRRLDERHTGRWIRQLDVLQRRRVERLRARVLGHREGCVDEVGEVFGHRHHLARVLADDADLLPAVQLLGVIERPHVIFGVPGRNQRLVVGERHPDRLLEHHAERTEAVRLRGGADVRHPRIHRRDVLGRQRANRDANVLVDGARRDVQLGTRERQRRRLSGFHRDAVRGPGVLCGLALPAVVADDDRRTIDTATDRHRASRSGAVGVDGLHDDGAARDLLLAHVHRERAVARQRAAGGSAIDLQPAGVSGNYEPPHVNTMVHALTR